MTRMTCIALLAITATAFAQDKPNIVLIMADDMGFECVAANGGETYQTPRLDRMAKQGMRFEHCYSQPLCTPSRVQIMTGRYNSRNYIRFGFLDKQARTFAHLFKNAGYATCIVGKWQLSGRNPEAFGDPKLFGFDEYCLWQLTHRPNRYPNPGLEINGKEVDFNNGEYGPDITSDYACRFIEKNQDRPFLLYYPMILPHWPFEPTPDSPDWDPTFRRGDPSEKNLKMRKQKHFVDMVHYTDKLVGKVIDKIDALGLGKNTLILFTGDNGTYSGITSRFKGRDWKGGKGCLKDNGTHVPLIVRWTGRIKPGTVSKALVDFSDMLPTMADAADLKVTDTCQTDGRSFLPQLLNGKAAGRPWVYCWYYRSGKPAKPGGFAAGETARTQRYKLYKDGRLFDLQNDPHEEIPLNEKAASLTDEEKQTLARLGKVIEQYTRPGFHKSQGSRKDRKKK